MSYIGIYREPEMNVEVSICYTILCKDILFTKIGNNIYINRVKKRKPGHFLAWLSHFGPIYMYMYYSI